LSSVGDHDLGYEGGDVREAYDAGFAEGRQSGKRDAFTDMLKVADQAFEEGRALGFDEGYEAGTNAEKAAALRRWLAA
jgi:hypothetical protein